MLISGLLTGGCVSSSPQPIAWQQHQLAVSALKHWHLRSKLGYTSDSDSGSAWLDWEQSGDRASAHISGPFGAGSAQLISSTQGATLKRPGETDIHADSAGELTHKLFGWPFPIEQLRYWVRGLPAPGIPVTTFASDSRGLLSHLEQGAWVLTFIRYQNTSAGPLPSKIKVSTGNLQIKLVIKEWQLPALSRPKPGISARPQNRTAQSLPANGI